MSRTSFYKIQRSLSIKRSFFLRKWHPGIIPIITARIAKQYNRPTIVISIDQGFGKGSIRTIPEFPLLQHLRDMQIFWRTFGGHDFAAGLTIKEENIEKFQERFIAAANKMLKEQDVVAKLHLDAKINFGDSPSTSWNRSASSNRSATKTPLPSSTAMPNRSGLPKSSERPTSNSILSKMNGCWKGLLSAWRKNAPACLKNT